MSAPTLQREISLRFIFDHNLSPNLARALGLLVEPYGDEVTCLKDLGWQADDDEEWMIRRFSPHGKKPI